MSQNSTILPTTGTLSGLQAVQKMNDALDTLNTKFSGSGAPSSPEVGQDWLDNSTAPATLKMWDGAAWVALGQLDATNHVWSPTFAGAISAIASATTTSLGSQVSPAVSITGTTTITSFGTAPAGTVKFVSFAGALTLTHNATSLILQGAANIQAAAGDTATFESLGSGNWRCLNYTPARVSPINFLGATLSATGYQKLPNGLTLQWGTVTGISVGAGVGTSASTNPGFPVAFASACFMVVATSNASQVFATVPSFNASGFTAQITNVTGGGVTSDVNWYALGV